MKYAFVNGIILDGSENMEPQNNMIIFTDGEKITAISPKGSDTDGYEIVDLNGSYIMPGLINMHLHLPASGKPQKKQRDNAKLVKLVTSNPVTRRVALMLTESNARIQLMSGVTTLRTMGGILNYDSKARDRINSGKTLGPRILAANMAVSVPGGHMAGSLAYEAHSSEEAASFVRKIAQDRPDIIKLMITGGVLDAKVKGGPGALKMPPEYVKAACDEAHRLGFKVAAHVESPVGVKVALENGVDSIEHGAQPDEEIIDLFKKRGAFLVATISPALPYALFDRSVSCCSEVEQFNGKVVFDGMISCVKACLENGIPVALGTDTGCPYTTHYNTWRELYNFSKFCGVSNNFALHTATQINARLAGLESVTGSIEVGKSADFVVTADNPLDDLTALRNIGMVVTRGSVIREPKLKKMPTVEHELDKYL